MNHNPLNTDAENTFTDTATNQYLFKYYDSLLTDIFKGQHLKKIESFFKKYPQEKININQKEKVIKNIEVILTIKVSAATLILEFNNQNKCVNTMLLQLNHR